MSEELLDEVEAINSIYGPDTLTPYVDSQSGSNRTSSPVYILTLPGAEDDSASAPSSSTTSLRLQFPPSYPSEPFTILGIHSSGEHGKRGAGARDLNLFSTAVGEVYEPGQVCLFDAIEKVKELQSQEKHDTAGDEGSDKEDVVDHNQEYNPESDVYSSSKRLSSPTGGVVLDQEPPWVISSPITELKSTFIARCAPVTSPTQAAGFVQHLLSVDKRVRAATHNITAWRIRGPNGTSFQDCDDDGETAAGGRLLHLMQLMDLWDTMVIVTRWYGGQKLGPRRFALINAAARDAFVNAGLVVANETTAGGGGSKKKGHGK
ncbi:Ribosomal protein S5 domain 2-type fold [Naviculisporaceae sp. PSN 640]